MATEHLLDLYFIVRFLLFSWETPFEKWTNGIWRRSFGNLGYANCHATKQSGVWCFNLYRFLYFVGNSNRKNNKKNTIHSGDAHVLRVVLTYKKYKFGIYRIGRRIADYGTKSLVSKLSNNLFGIPIFEILFYRLFFPFSLDIFVFDGILSVGDFRKKQLVA